MDDIFLLPADAYNQSIDREIVIQYFRSTQDTVKAKSILTKNAISLVIKGNKTMHFAEKTVHANDKEIHFLSAGNCIASIEFQVQEEFKSILIFFDEHLLADFFARQKKSLVTANKTKQPYISLKKDDFIRNYINSLELVLQHGKKISEQMSLLKFGELMQYLLEYYPDTLLSFQYRQQHNFDDVTIRKTVEANVTGNLTVEELAFLCNMSASTFKRRFRDIYNTSPINWFVEERMKIAGKLLSNKKTKPADVYHQLGYENHSSFSRSFRKYYGMSPKEYAEANMTV